MKISIWVSGCLVFGLWIGSGMARGQEFLKQLESRLKDAAAKVQNGNATNGPVDTGPDDTGLGEDEGTVQEELPVPSVKPAVKPADKPAELSDRSTESSGEAMPFPSRKPKVTPPLVITPKRKPVPSEKTQPSFSEADRDLQSGYLGLTVEPLEGGGFGLAVVEVAPRSPAWKSGFREGDRVIGIGGQAITTVDQFAKELQRFVPGMPVKFLVQRRGRSLNLTAVLQDRAISEQIQGSSLESSNPTDIPFQVPYQPISGSLMNDGGWVLGVSVSDLSEAFRRQFGIPVYRGASISEVVVGSAAERAGLRPGDCLVEIDGRMINFAEDVVDATRAAVPGQSLSIGFYRGRQRMYAEVPVLPENGLEDGSAGASMGPAGAAMKPHGIASSEYVAQLEAEVQRLHAELLAMQERVQELEMRMQRTAR